MRGQLIDVIENRLDDLQREAAPEQAREIRELQQLLVGLQDVIGDGDD